MIRSLLLRYICAVSILFSFTNSSNAQSTTPFEGYTFVANGKSATLYDMNKNIIHKWTSAYSVSSCADLLRDSSVLFPSNDNGAWREQGALQGGRLQIIKWDGTVTWDFLYRSADYMPHHDIEPVYYTNDPKEVPNVLIACYTKWGDKITELKPTGKNTAEVVWEWYASDHTCPAGTGKDKPEFLEIGKGGNASIGGDYDEMHVNYISYNRALDQIIFDNKGYNEVMVIDHSTTTAQAKTRSGGKYGKGGDILYRWGCPSNYGVSGTQYLNGQHCGSWVLDTFPGTNLPLPGARNMIAISNEDRKIIEWTPAGAKTGVYTRTAGQAFEPSAPVWSFTVNDMQTNEGSVQRLPNGNTLICTGGVFMTGGSSSRIFEINSAGTTVWSLTGVASTKAARYAPGYLGGTSASISSKNRSSLSDLVKITLNPKSKLLKISSGFSDPASISVHAINGKLILSSMIQNGTEMNMNKYPNGLYIVEVKSGNNLTKQTITLSN